MGEIKWTYAYLINNELGTIEEKQAGLDYKEYLNFLIENINSSRKQTDYNITSTTTQ